MIRVTERFSKREAGLDSESAHERQRDGAARVRTVYIFVHPGVRRHVRGRAGAKLQQCRTIRGLDALKRA